MINTDTNSFSIAFLFYSIYISITELKKQIFLLPLLLYYYWEKAAQSTKFLLFGGLVYRSKVATSYQYLHILPFWFSRDVKQENSRQLFHILFPLFWKYKTMTSSFSCILPLYWFYHGKGWYIRHLWPFFGIVNSKDKFNEWSILYPFFRYRKNTQDVGWIVHIGWPLVCYKTQPGYTSMRLVPFFWIRFADNWNSGKNAKFLLKKTNGEN